MEKRPVAKMTTGQQDGKPFRCYRHEASRVWLWASVNNKSSAVAMLSSHYCARGSDADLMLGRNACCSCDDVTEPKTSPSRWSVDFGCPPTCIKVSARTFLIIFSNLAAAASSNMSRRHRQPDEKDLRWTCRCVERRASAGSSFEK